MTNPDSGVVIIATLTATPQNRDHLLRAVQELLPAARAETGVYTFLIHENRQQPGQFTLYEHFRDQTAIDTHFSSPHFGRVSNALAQYADGPAILTYHLPPTTPSHRNSALRRSSGPQTTPDPGGSGRALNPGLK